MFRRRHVPVAQLREELACPRCEYSLKGRTGDLVTCPECGLQCDVARLITSQWTGPWYRAPGFNRIIVPVAWPAVGMWVVLLIHVWEIAGGRPPLFTLLSLATVLGGWLRSLWQIRNQMPGGRAMLLSGLAHLVFVGYFLGLVTTLWLLAYALTMLSSCS